jgi:PAS domain S-box-containing protein
VRTGESLTVPDAQVDERHFTGIDQLTGFAPRSVVSVPLRAQQDVIGVLQVLDAQVGRFQAPDLLLLEPLAASAAIAIRNARLYEAVARSTREWEATFDAITDGIAILDRAGVIVRANRPMANILNTSLEDMIGRAYSDDPGCERALFRWCLHQQVLKEGTAQATEIDEPELGGIYLVSGYPLWDTQGEIVGSVCVIKDVTQQRQAREQLFLSEKLAALGRLTASLAHEINNPLHALSSGLRLLNRPGLDEGKRAQYLGIAAKEVDRLIGIAGRIAGYYRPSSDTSSLTDIHALLDEMLTLAAKKLEQSQVAVRRDWSNDLPPVQAVADQLKQVFLNLILNATDAMSGGGTLTISTGRIRAKPTVYVRFADTGHGIAPEDLGRIFEPFYTTRAQGTGLGLSISYGIVEQHGGHIQVESQLGHGTAFTVILPLESSS